ncbi:hypothetical protein BD413DRAFT_610348 [Trametes elegans]|nr:hypothetical protein BD413DRAFT_610348 [Trametes elegans]
MPTSASPSSDQQPDPAKQSATGKAKQTRKRQRLSCVECTRRRQKCDRQIPCGLCVSRGVPQLCRWEPIVARPAPQRPPEGAPTVAVPEAAHSTIAALSARIAALEEVISRQSVQIRDYAGTDGSPPAQGTPPTAVTVASLLASQEGSSPSDASSSDRSTKASRSSGAGTSSTASTSSPECVKTDSSVDEDEECALSHYDYDVQSAAVALAQLSLAPQDEYIGTGTIPYALHKLGDPYRAKWSVARSADTTTVSEPFTPGNHPLSGPIQQLSASLPPQETVERLVDGYLAERNWQFGIPEQWFRRSCESMWRHLRLRCPGLACHLSGGCPRCTEELNPHWLALLFAVLALAPHRLVGGMAKTYFLKAMEARRLVEDILLASRASSGPSAVQGVVLSCIGGALLARYLADRGRVSDAWKLTGTALRNAQAVGLHRDPGWQKWESMDKQELELRVLGWWLLVMSDRLYSFTLGRPMMATEGTFDVKLVPTETHGDGSRNPYATFEQNFIGLCELIGEMVYKCMGMQFPAYATVLELDRKFKFWLCRLHPSLDWRQPHETSNPATLEERTTAYQRHICAAYYLGTLMNLHRPYLMHAPPILPPPKPLSATMTVIMNPSRERCIELAMELLRVMCDAQEEAAAWAPDPELPARMFHYAYFTFDGAVALVGAFSQEPPHPKAAECLALVDRAMRMLSWCADVARAGGAPDGEGETASRAITILTALRKAGRWDERFTGRKDGGGKRTGRSAARADGGALSSGSSSSASPPMRASPSQAPAQENAGALQQVHEQLFPYMQPAGMSLANPPQYAPAAAYAGMGTVGAGADPAQIPFLTGTMFPYGGGPLQALPSATLPVSSFADGARDFGILPGTSGYDGDGGGASNGVNGASRGGGGGANLQSMFMPLETGQASENYDVDWSAFSEIQGWSVNGLFESV